LFVFPAAPAPHPNRARFDHRRQPKALLSPASTSTGRYCCYMKMSWGLCSVKVSSASLTADSRCPLARLRRGVDLPGGVGELTVSNSPVARDNGFRNRASFAARRKKFCANPASGRRGAHGSVTHHVLRKLEKCSITRRSIFVMRPSASQLKVLL
jgi:hypothetical protein